ncbi:unnamed protein product [Amaranthus hypochondriacus]
MAAVISSSPFSPSFQYKTVNSSSSFKIPKLIKIQYSNPSSSVSSTYGYSFLLVDIQHGKAHRRLSRIHCKTETDPEDQVQSTGVKVALSMLNFYKREISPLLPKSCRYVPSCSEYSMIAYKKYGVVKGTVLTAYRLCRCNPLGGSGFDPPRWFGEERPSEE